MKTDILEGPSATRLAAQLRVRNVHEANRTAVHVLELAEIHQEGEIQILGLKVRWTLVLGTTTITITTLSESCQ